MPHAAIQQVHLTPAELAYNNKGEILTITCTVTSIALLAVILRIYVRVVMLRVFGSDDYVIVGATVS